jgi:ribosomal protein S12 methylthiotransferase
MGLKPGDFVDVEIDDSDEHDLFGDALAKKPGIVLKVIRG